MDPIVYRNGHKEYALGYNGELDGNDMEWALAQRQRNAPIAGRVVTQNVIEGLSLGPAAEMGDI
jgi:hypothetical protein